MISAMDIAGRPIRWAAFFSMLVVVAVVALAWGGQRSPRYEPEVVAGPGLTGLVGTSTRSCHGVRVKVTDNVRAVMKAHPPGTTFCLAAGTHRLRRPLVPSRGDALIGLEGAVLSGSKVLRGWRREGKAWSARGFLPSSPGTHGECLPSVPTCSYTEDVFLDGRRLRRVTSKPAVTRGTVFADYRANTITIGDDPRRRKVEQAVAPSLIRSTADDVTVANLVVEQAANEAQTGAIESRQITPYMAGTGWRVLGNEVRLNHGVGIGFASGTIVADNFIHHQGQLGFGAWGTGAVVRNNEISFNGAAGYTSEWEAGGSKSWRTTRQTITNNYVHHNMGPGLWTDGGNIGTIYAYNRIVDNWRAGIQHEISYDATIEHNVISGNGRKHKGWAWEAGIQIQSSGGTKLIEIAHNVVRGNANGITLIDSGDRTRERPAPHGRHVVKNVWVHDNTVTMFAGQTTGAVEDTGDPGIFTTNDNRFSANTYLLDSLSTPHFSWDGREVNWRRWHLGIGNDLNGRAEPAPRRPS